MDSRTREVELVYRVIDREYTEGKVPTASITRLHGLVGSKGAVSLQYSFLKDPIAARASWGQEGDRVLDLIALMPMGVDTHALAPQYEGHSSMPCKLIGGVCYPDGSGLRAIKVLEEFQSYGEEWLRGWLEAEYHIAFYPQEYGDLVPDDEVLERLGFGQMMDMLFKGVSGEGP